MSSLVVAPTPRSVSPAAEALACAPLRDLTKAVGALGALVEGCERSRERDSVPVEGEEEGWEADAVQGLRRTQVARWALRLPPLVSRTQRSDRQGRPWRPTAGAGGRCG